MSFLQGLLSSSNGAPPGQMHPDQLAQAQALLAPMQGAISQGQAGMNAGQPGVSDALRGMGQGWAGTTNAGQTQGVSGQWINGFKPQESGTPAPAQTPGYTPGQTGGQTQQQSTNGYSFPTPPQNPNPPTQVGQGRGQFPLQPANPAQIAALKAGPGGTAWSQDKVDSLNALVAKNAAPSIDPQRADYNAATPAQQAATNQTLPGLNANAGAAHPQVDPALLAKIHAILAQSQNKGSGSVRREQ